MLLMIRSCSSYDELENSLHNTKYPCNRATCCQSLVGRNEATAQERHSNYFVHNRYCRYTCAAIYASLVGAISLVRRAQCTKSLTLTEGGMHVRIMVQTPNTGMRITGILAFFFAMVLADIFASVANTRVLTEA